MTWISSYGCTSAAGPSAAALWHALVSGERSSSLLWNKTGGSVFDLLNMQIATSWNEALEGLSPHDRDRVTKSENLGVILASTKGFIDDLVWTPGADLSRDTLSPLLDHFLKRTGLHARRRTVVSNACTSGLAALAMARHWLSFAGLDDVIVISADHAGGFVQQGFATLRVITPDMTRPFSAARSGFQIGDASACVIVSKHRSESSLALLGVGVDAEGFATTRPSQAGTSLEAACRRLPLDKTPDLILAHGTATQINDVVEDRVYARLFDGQKQPLITASKWLTGHTLGVSGALDVINACSAIKTESAFHIANTDDADPAFQGRYLTKKSTERVVPRYIMISSLGFGGIHAAALVARPA